MQVVIERVKLALPLLRNVLRAQCYSSDLVPGQTKRDMP